MHGPNFLSESSQYLYNKVRTNLLKDFKDFGIFSCRFWWARVFTVESLACKAIITISITNFDIIIKIYLES